MSTVTAYPIFACDCTRLEEKAALEKADLVFTGKVNAASRLRFILFTRDGDVNIRKSQTYFITNEVKKGRARPVIAVLSNQSLGRCGVFFKEGENYLVYAFKTIVFDEVVYETNMCFPNVLSN